MIHSRGLVRVGEASVVIAASSAHQKDALGAVSSNRSTQNAPIWKRDCQTTSNVGSMDIH